MLKQSGTRFFPMMLLLLVATVILTACPLSMPAAESVDDAQAVTKTDVVESNSETDESASDSSNSVDESAASGSITFTIIPEGTEARFSIYELLMGRDKTVVGATSAVQGSITVDPANPSNVSISPIRIDASTLATDSSRRDGAIKRWILETNREAYQYIVFTPTAIEGLPDAVTVGAPFEFTVTGDLTIRDVTKQETFTLSATATSATELVGLGQITIMRGDYNLTIPSVPSVANVGEEVPLEIEFTAVAG